MVLFLVLLLTVSNSVATVSLNGGTTASSIGNSFTGHSGSVVIGPGVSAGITESWIGCYGSASGNTIATRSGNQYRLEAWLNAEGKLENGQVRPDSSFSYKGQNECH